MQVIRRVHCQVQIKREKGKVGRASLDEKLVSLGRSMLSHTREGDFGWKDRACPKEKHVSHSDVLVKDDSTSDKNGLLSSANEEEQEREVRASLDKGLVSLGSSMLNETRYGDFGWEDRASPKGEVCFSFWCVGKG